MDLSSLNGTTSTNLTDIPQAGTAEKVISIYFLDLGDYAHNFLGKIFGEEITIDKIVFNKVDLLNANFFNNTTNPASNNISTIVRKSINQWFGYFKSLALVVIMVSIVAAGIRILLQTPQAKVKGYESLKKVVMAVALIFFFPYVMKFAFEINETIIGYINQANTSGFVGAVPISPYTNADEEDIEFRSPKYVSTEGKLSNSSSSDNTEIYLNQVSQYEKNVDIMRLMRAFAGVTYRFVYVILWYIMLAQVYILAFIYIKRYLTIAFLIIVYPLVIIGHVVDGISGKRKGSFNTWSQKFFSTVFLQTLHAIMYGIISGVIVNQVLKTGDGTPGSEKINVILMIVTTSFLFSGEKILTKFWKSSTDSSAERKGLKQAFGMPRRVVNTFKGK